MGACANLAGDWILPNIHQWESVIAVMKRSGRKHYITNAQGNMCYFPISGDASFPNAVGVSYWSTTIASSDEKEMYVMNISSENNATDAPRDWKVSSGSKHPVRCIMYVKR